VIVVAVAMLLVLARFRYPIPDGTAAMAVAGPIERLAARATFEELALIMADLTTRVQPDLTVITLEQIPAVGTKRIVEPPARRFVAALRVDTDLALIYLPPGFRVAESPGVSQATEDPARGLALVQVVPGPFTSVGPLATAVGGPGYVAVFEGARGGPSPRPLFIGRVDSFDDPRWSLPLMSVGGAPQLGPGTFIYTLDGRLVGMTVPDSPGVAIARVPALLAAVEALRTQ
jgi:hypothetical protein